MNNRRSNVEVIADILRLGQAGKTEIMYSANMSYRQLQKYLEFLVQNGFIDVMKVGNPVTVYKVNEKGLKLLNKIENLLEMLPLNGKGSYRL
jgi:predicted transcriptional regulator